MIKLVGYKKCSTCKNACKYLEEKRVAYAFRDIKENPFTEEEIRHLIDTYSVNVDRLFNTSGILYRELNLKEKRPQMSMEEKIEILTRDGMLVKRPLLITEGNLLIGFREKEWENLWKN